MSDSQQDLRQVTCEMILPLSVPCRSVVSAPIGEAPTLEPRLLVPIVSGARPAFLAMPRQAAHRVYRRQLSLPLALQPQLPLQRPQDATARAQVLV